jgi:hypothetical protein
MYFTFAKTRMELAQCGASLGDQQAATRIPIETVH